MFAQKKQTFYFSKLNFNSVTKSRIKRLNNEDIQYFASLANTDRKDELSEMFGANITVEKKAFFLC